MNFRFLNFDFRLAGATGRCRLRRSTGVSPVAGARGHGRDARATGRAGFTFTEVMFAVILLGIGFIMVAAIFPVAIQQSQANLEDAAGIAVADHGAAIMSTMGPAMRTYNGTVVPGAWWPPDFQVAVPPPQPPSPLPHAANPLVPPNVYPPLPRELIYHVNCDQGFVLTNATGGYYLKAGTPLHRFTDPNLSTPPTWWTSRDVVDRGIFNWPIDSNNLFGYLPTQPNFPYPPITKGGGSPGGGMAPASWLPLGYAPPYLNTTGPLVGNFISTDDARYAWMPVAYQFSFGLDCNPPGTIKIWMLAMKARNQSQYTNKDTLLYPINGSNNNSPPSGTFVPKVEFFYLRDTGTKPNLLTFIRWTPNGNFAYVPPNAPANCSQPFDPPEAVEGAYVFVADDRVGNPINDPNYPGYPTINGLAIVRPGQANGRFYRLGAKRTDLGVGVWELAPGDGPGHDMSPASYQPGQDNILGTADDLEVNDNIPPRTTATANAEMNSSPPAAPGGSYIAPAMGYIVGKGYVDPANPALGFEGSAQDLIAFPITVAVPQ